jgi:hypothetical protein
MATDPYSSYCERLSATCVAVDLATVVLRDPSQVKVWHPGLECYTELISCRQVPGSGVLFLWSWGAPIGPVVEPQKAATAIARVVSPSLAARQVPVRRGRR